MFYQKNPRAHKNKIGTPDPPPKPKIPPPQKEEFYGHGGFPGAHKIGAATSGPRIADKKFTDTRLFPILGPKMCDSLRSEIAIERGGGKLIPIAGIPAIPESAVKVAGEWRCTILVQSSGKSKRGLSKGGLSPKGANRAKKGPFGAISAFPPSLWGAEELVPIGPEKAPTSPEMAPICPEKARFSRKDFPPIFSENLGLKPPFVSPPLDFPKIRTPPAA